MSASQAGETTSKRRSTESAWRFWQDRLGSPKNVMAPMTGVGDVPFRQLCRRYGVQLCYTPMLYAKHFATQQRYLVMDPSARQSPVFYLSVNRYRDDNFKTKMRYDTLTNENPASDDRPLIAQFAASDARSLVAAAQHIEAKCDAIDINLDWNQAKAAGSRKSPTDGPYGAFLQEEWSTVLEMVSTAAVELSIPVTCKMRLFESLPESIARALELEDAGCSVLTVHGCTRSQKGKGKGVSNWSDIAAIKKAVSIPVIANGSVLDKRDAEVCLSVTGADAIMCGDGLLHNPALFRGGHPAVQEIGKEYLTICKEIFQPPASTIRDHLARFFALGLLTYPEIRSELASAYSHKSFSIVLDRIGTLAAAAREGERDRTSAPEYDIWTCQAAIPHDPDQFDVRTWKRYPGDVCQAEASRRKRHCLLEANPGINFQLQDQDLLSKTAAKRLDSIHTGIKRADNERKRKRPRHDPPPVPAGPHEHVSVPADKMGLVIGTRGGTLSTLQQLSGATIVVVRQNDDVACEGESTRQVTVYGSQDQINDARERIQRVVRGEKIIHKATAERERQRERLRKAMRPDGGSLRIALDLGLEDQMSLKELQNLAKQISRIYGFNLNSEGPAHLFLTGLQSDSSLDKILHRYCSGFNDYVLTRSNTSHSGFFSKDEIVYLTPDSQNPLLQLDAQKVYVIGGLVDEHIIKNFTLNKADSVGINTARLPIPEMAKRISEETPKSANLVLSPNVVFEILLKFWNSRDWETAFAGSLPSRKGYTAARKATK